MKKFTFKGVLDGFRSTVQPQVRPEQEIQETLQPNHFTLRKTFRHGFPHSPTALAYDPIQKLLAIGDKSGSLRILGRFGVDAHIKHEGESACGVMHIQFIVNEGNLVTATADDSLHLWNYRSKTPQVVQSLKFQRERITCLHLPFGSKWLHVGTEKGNIHVVHIDTFSLSGYIINWNKAIDPIRKTHPGAVVHLSDNPLDANKLLIGFESGQLVLWDMRGKFAEFRWITPEPLRSISWHHEGKHFITSHTDGSLCTWPLRISPKPLTHVYPHAKTKQDGKLEICKPIHKVEIKTNRNGEQYTIFSGGLSMEKGGKSPCITVLVQGKSTTVLEMEHPVVDFITICESPWPSETQEPYAIAVLLQNDLVLIDLLSSGYPTFESPYSMDLHESQVTCCTYLADCPSDLVPAFYSVGRSTSTSRRTGYSEREWPVNGGDWQPTSCSYSEIIMTGHLDGSVKFWDSSAGTLQHLYKLKTAKIFDKPRTRSMDGSDDDPLAIQLISLCAESRRLCLAGNSGHVILFKFRRLESTSDTLVLEIPITYENFEDVEGSPECEFIPRSLPKQPESTDSEKKNDGMLKVKSGQQRKPPGFQAQLVCLSPWTNGSHPGQITSLCINSSYGLMAYGTEYGLVIVDVVQKVCLLNVASPDLYGAQDPYSRAPKSPKRLEAAQLNKDEQARSPSIDQSTELSTSPLKIQQFTSLSAAMPPTSIASDMLTGSNQTSGSNSNCNTSRPPSPACDAMDELGGGGGSTTLASSDTDNATTPDDLKEKIEKSQRKSSTWKAFSFKRQLSKAELKIKNTFRDKDQPATTSTRSKGSIFFGNESEMGVPLSPIEVSPDSDRNNSNSTPTSSPEQNSQDNNNPNDGDLVDDTGGISGSKSPYPDAQNLPENLDSKQLNVDDVTDKLSKLIAEQKSEGDVDNNDLPSAEPKHHPEIKKMRSVSQMNPTGFKKVDFNTVEEVCTKVNVSETDGAFISRPSVLPLAGNVYDGSTSSSSAGVQPPARLKKLEKRNQRLMSVPNIKLIKQDSQGFGNKTEVTGAVTGSKRPKSSKNEQSFAGNLMRRFSRVDKLDSSFSRSRSSSMSSLDNVTSEAITCLSFADSYTKKSDPSAIIPTLWLGTSLGSVLTVSIVLPESDSRKTQAVLVSILGGPIFRLKGSILSMSFLDCNGALIPYSYEPWKDDIKEGKDRRDRTPTKSTANRMSPTLGAQDSFSDRQFVAITSEKQSRVIALPSQNCVYRQQLADTDCIIKAEIISMKDSVCLVCYSTNGHLLAYSLPSLRPLLDVDFLPLADLSFQTKCKQGIVDPMLAIWGQQVIVHEDTNQISKTFSFSNKGHGLYLATPTEIQKFTICAEFCQILNEMLGELFLPHEMPEPPKESFFKGLFGGGTRSLDREELFGESSGKANRSVAKHIPGPNADLQALGQRANTAASEVSRAHQLMLERGDKLSQLEDRTERMSNEAQQFSNSAHLLMNKYKDKKWYQL
uniref:Putative integral to membrane n=1 Tax=Corethrella appendiculata TaxID=1370023 RepID=W4VR65_9DIPT